MYSSISNDAKAALKANAVTITARITLTSSNTVIDGDNLKTITITDQCYENGVIVGTAMCKEVEIELLRGDFGTAYMRYRFKSLGEEHYQKVLNYLLKKGYRYQDIETVKGEYFHEMD